MAKAFESISPDQILSVGQYTEQIKQLLEGQIPPCWIRGEISNLKEQSSGHFYFTLKDAQSQLPGVLFRGNAIQQGLRLREGMQLLVYGEISLYAPRGAYQLIARCLLEEGQGRLALELERLKQKLKEEGLFDHERKKQLPFFPQKIGVISSPTGAAIQDFLKILKRHAWTGEIILFPAKVQGTGSIREIASQIRCAGAYQDLDLLIITRGGGSLEDLWSFNEEGVVRAVAACPHPTLSAIGHEIDFTLCDYAADFRAETPSAAASWVVNQKERFSQRWSLQKIALQQKADFLFTEKQQRLFLLKEQFRQYHPQRSVEQAYLRLDELFSRLQHLQEATFLHAKLHLRPLQERLKGIDPLQVLSQYQRQIQQLKSNLKRSFEHRMSRFSQDLLHLKNRLENSKLERLLGRGLIYLKDAQDQIIKDQASIQPNTFLKAYFKDGVRRIQVE